MTAAAPASRRPSLLSIGVVIWLSSELMFFSGLFAGWFTLRAGDAPWPPEGVELAVLRTGAATVVLLASSVTMHRAVVAAEAHQRRTAMRWLGITAVMGLVFLANLASEYIEADFSISSHAFGSMFYLMTGFHGLHVIGGLVFMATVAIGLSGRTSRLPVGQTVNVCGTYWHFVDAVWAGMFLTIYVLT